MFYHPAEDREEAHEFQTFFDGGLIGEEDTVDRYVRNGGIDGYLRQVIGDTAGCTYSLQAKESSILVYTVMQDGEAAASVVVWTGFGQFSIRSERPSVTFHPAMDYGSIQVFPVWDSTDFSSVNAITAYVGNGGLNARMGSAAPGLQCSLESYRTANHDYVLCKDETGPVRFAAYIPVTPAEGRKWIVVFMASKESQVASNAYAIQEGIMETFKILK